MDRRGARRAAAFVFTLALLTFLMSVYVALVYHGDFSQGADWVVTLDFGEWIAVFAIILAVLFLILLILFAASTQSALETQNPDLQVECAQCHKSYVIEDTGQRPLYHVCPHCTYTNVLGEGVEAPMAEPIEAPEPGPAVAATAEVEETEEQVVEREEGGVMRKFLVLRCGACATQFETPYSAERPLITACGNCGRKGILRGRAAPTRSASGRPISEIEGIGPEFTKRLNEQGVFTIPDLRAADATILGLNADISADTIREWQGMAELMAVKGIGPQYSELLVKSGIVSVRDLSQADPDELLARIDAATAARQIRIQGNAVGKRTVKNWINAAKKAA